MGFLNLFSSKPKEQTLLRLPSGSFTLDRDGNVITSTLPQSVPESHLRHISQHVLATFRAAQAAQMPLSEIVIQYASIKLLARELRGGAIVFLMPHAFQAHSLKAVPQPE
jgi:hypothetical protein